MTCFKKTMLLLALLVSYTYVNSAFSFNAPTHVKISNKLGNGLDLTLHCKSRDDDLGVHLLHQDESFSFQFHPNIFRSTLFWCSFRWSGQTKSFDIFDGGRDYLLTDLKWSASPTQICDENKKVCYDYNKLRVTT
ncbi:hypothetical protein CISIN_1g047836mg [Citrus sinensis]|uniref:S-protein homolog n=1 Tax=Citrus sinensis TaxID=2711 RepID=A0A067E8R5_CITSI|nr:hypothetical protein CISIN_1g047836mg [Citrus sinensis]